MENRNIIMLSTQIRIIMQETSRLNVNIIVSNKKNT